MLLSLLVATIVLRWRARQASSNPSKGDGPLQYDSSADRLP